MSDQATRALVHRLYESYSKGDGETISALVHDDVDWIIHAPVQVFSFAGPRHGKSEVLGVLTEIARDYALERYEPEIIVVEEERAAVLSSVAFKQRSTGRTLSYRNANFLRFSEGRLIEFREFIDTFDIVEQALGRWLVI
jgi:ketosteroid isomerase-like protein